MSDEIYRSKTLKIDKTAKSNNPDEPAFIAKPEGSPVYYGFPLVPETETDGYIFGTISDYLEFDSEEGCTYGDGFVQAPDGSRAGLIWDVSEKIYISESIPPEENRWGVYNIGFVKPIKTINDLIFNFRQVLPLLKEMYKKTKKTFE